MNASRWIDRARASFENPVFRREVRTLGRRGRFAWTVFVLTLALTLVIASVGARASAGVHPALLGKVLFQTFFGIAQALVLFAGPALAAGSVAGEREGHTLEALVLTGMGPRRIAWGKTLAAVAHVGAYAVAFAPVGAMPFLFGGVPATSALVAFAMLAVETVVATLVGLAISTRVSSTRAALVASVGAGVVMAAGAHFGLGDALGDAVCGALNVQRAGTIWLPVLIAEGGPASTSGMMVGAALLVGAAMASWFLLESCAASLADPGSDSAAGIKRWFVVSVALATGGSIAFVASSSTRVGRAGAAVAAIAAYALFSAFAALVFQGDALVPPRRLRKVWQAAGASRLRRFLGPGAISSAALQLGAAAVALGAMAVAGVVLSLADDFGPATSPLGVVAAALPAGTLVLFIVGVATLARTVWGTAVGRAVLALTLVVLAFGPYAVAAIASGGTLDPDAAGLFAPPSPAFLLDVAIRVGMDVADGASIAAAVVSSVGYAVVGLATLIVASVRIERANAVAEAEAARVDALLADEDAGRVAPPRASVAPPGPFPLAPRASQPPPARDEAAAPAPRVEPESAAEPVVPEPAALPVTATFASPTPAPARREPEAKPDAREAPRAASAIAYRPRESPFAAPPQIPVERPPPRPRVDDVEERIADRAIPVDMDLIPEEDPRDERRRREKDGGT